MTTICTPSFKGFVPSMFPVSTRITFQGLAHPGGGSARLLLS